MYKQFTKIVTALSLLGLVNCSPTSFSNKPESQPEILLNSADGGTETPGRAQSPNLQKVAASTCAGLNTLITLPGSRHLEDGSTFSCYHCTEYSEFSQNPSLGPITSCVREIYQPAGFDRMIQAARYSWTTKFSCTPRPEGECDLHGDYYVTAWPYGVTIPFGGPLDPDNLPAGLHLVQ